MSLVLNFLFSFIQEEFISNLLCAGHSVQHWNIRAQCNWHNLCPQQTELEKQFSNFSVNKKYETYSIKNVRPASLNHDSESLQGYTGIYILIVFLVIFMQRNAGKDIL